MCEFNTSFDESEIGFDRYLFRIKTEKELERDLGTNWTSKVTCGFNNYMHGILGWEIGGLLRTDCFKVIIGLERSFMFPDARSNYWHIPKEMIHYELR